jgi:ketosteroid isomerase-like protein
MKPTLQISLLVACTVWASSPAWPDSEDLKVQRVITDLAEAYMAFPQTRDRHSVMKYFAPDYSFFDDGGPRSLDDVERMLADLEQDLARGPLVITEQISDIAVHPNGAVAWATYEDRVTIARHGDTTEDAALCTAIFHKTVTGWVYQHEHCSSYPLGNESDPQELTKLTWILERSAAE